MKRTEGFAPLHLFAQDNVAAELLVDLLDSAMDGIVVIDEAQRIVLFNPAAEVVFGRSQAQALGLTLSMLIPERFQAGHRRHIEEFGTTGVSSRRMGDGTVIYGRRANGEEFPLEASISQFSSARGKLFAVILRDVTLRLRAQEEIAALAAAAGMVREQEKARIARELHDEVTQSLTALKMDTVWLRDRLASDATQVSAKFDQMSRSIDFGIAASRRIASDLRPLMLDDLGLVPAIEWLTDNVTARAGVLCDLQLDSDLELEEPYATALFRIVQEALNNVVKHAGATRVEVGIKGSPTELRLWIQDNGNGFDPAASRKPQSLGLVGLRERAQHLKGTLRIDSAPGRGTRIELHVPMHQANPQQ